MATEKLPRRIKVSEVIAGRTKPGTKPLSWDQRSPGPDTVKTSSGELITLQSTGGQSTPAPGWELLLTKRIDGAYSWTLYGLSSAEPASR